MSLSTDVTFDNPIETDASFLAAVDVTLRPATIDGISYTATAGSEPGELRHFPIWVLGYHEHLLRWKVDMGRGACESCHHVDVEDGPDNVHDWYDHFYSAHSCGCRHG